MADVVIRVLGQTTTANRALGQTTRRVKSLGSATRRTGAPVRGLRTNLAGLSQTAGLAQSSMFQLTGSFLAVGGFLLALKATTRVSIGFQAEMTKLNTLVGVAPELVEQWSDSLRQMAPAVGVGPRELSKALFVVTSAGIRTGEALRIVELAAKASAIGLGDVASIARAVTSAMQAYAKVNLTAAEATDILVATVREGNLAADELASSLGRVLGIAAEVGVGFADLGGFIATFTRVGVTAEEAVTALRGILNTTLKPTKQARDALAEFGISIEDVRKAIKQDGLARTLIDLVSILRENEDALAAVFGNVRALSGILATAGAQAEEFDRIVLSVAEATGILEEGFLTVGATAQQALEEMKASIEVVAGSIGDKMLPAIAEWASEWAAIITQNDAAAQSMIGFLQSARDQNELAFRLNALGQARVKNEEAIAALELSRGRGGTLEGLNERVELLKSQNTAFAAGTLLIQQRAAAIVAAGPIAPTRENIFARPALLSEIQVAEIAAAAAAVTERMAADVELQLALSFVPDVKPIKIEPPDIDFSELLFGKDSVASMLAQAQALIVASQTPAQNLASAMDALRFAEAAGAITTDELRQAQEALNVQYQTSTRSFVDLATTVGPAIANVLAQAIRAIRGQGSGGVLGGLSGVLGAAAGVVGMINPLVGAGLLAGSLITGALASNREQPVRVQSFGPRAMQQQRDIQRGPDTIIVQVISPSTGELLDEIVYVIDRRTRTDAFERLPRSSAGTRERVGVPG